MASGSSVTLDGTGSFDPDVGDTLSYAWTAPAGITLSDATVVSPSFTAPTLGANDSAVTLTFSLVVTDDKGNASTPDTVTITVTPPDPSATEIIGSSFSSTVGGDNPVEITVVLRDANGNRINFGGSTVIFETNLGTLFVNPSGSSVLALDNGDGSYTAFLTSDEPGIAVVTVTVDGVFFGQITIEFFALEDAVSPVRTQISADNTSIAADGISTSTITVQLRNSEGEDITRSLGVVSLSTTLGTLSPVIDNEDGTYSAILTSAKVSGIATVSGTLDDVALSNVATVEMWSVIDDLFGQYQDEVLQIITADSERALRATLGANQRMVRNARERFIASQGQALHCSEILDANPDATFVELEGCDDGVASRNNVPFDVTGTAAFTNGVFSTQGSFFEQRGNVAGTQRRLFFGDFDIQHDGNTGSSTATLIGRIAWEHTVSERAMLGYFIGGELAQSDIRSTTFSGDNRRYGATIGGYAVYQLRENLYADGFATLGLGRNNLDMANDVLELESSYTTRTATIGGSLSGVVEYERFELRPELSISYGKTWIGTVGFAGRAYGLVEDNLSLDAGSVSLGQIMFRPEFRISLEQGEQGSGSSVVTFAPRLICETSRGIVSKTDCGGGVEFGIQGNSADGRSNVNAGASMDRVGKSTRTSIKVNLQHRF